MIRPSRDLTLVATVVFLEFLEFVAFVAFVAMAAPGPALAADLVHRREPPARAGECQNCHAKKARRFVPVAKTVTRQHAEIELRHGGAKLSCNACHDQNNHNLLYSSQGPGDFSHSAETCQSCHADVYRDWANGIHGKRSGGWANDQTRFVCIDCHNQHDISFAKMRAQPPPPLPHPHEKAHDE
jgi:nitrate/TMAO reductase-like tetraheme cytochrome c subunit